jgi:hypothetical protein
VLNCSKCRPVSLIKGVISKLGIKSFAGLVGLYGPPMFGVILVPSKITCTPAGYESSNIPYSDPDAVELETATAATVELVCPPPADEVAPPPAEVVAPPPDEVVVAPPESDVIPVIVAVPPEPPSPKLVEPGL